MRHRKHNHQLGVKSAHRISLVANLSSSLIEHGRIKTTLAKARALRPVIEKIITLAKKAHLTEDSARKIHYRRLAISRVRNKKAVSKLFDETVEQFLGRNGGYTRIYKLAIPRHGDAADMALIEFVEEAPKKKPKKKKSAAKKKKDDPKAEIREEADTVSEDPSVEPEAVTEENVSKADDTFSEAEVQEVTDETNDSDSNEASSAEPSTESK
jgi:large subunit ribosomal protein L17